MENLSAQIDLFLTEISIELLGNKMYDISGKRQDKIVNLFKALPENRKAHTSKSENSNDFLCSLGYQSDFSENESVVKQLLDEQFDFILENGNTSVTVNQDIISFLRNYKMNQKGLVDDVSNIKVKRIVERGKLMTHFNRSRVKILNQKKQNNEKEEAFQKYYDTERNNLLKMSMDTLRLMKYIINDTRNEDVKGELIGFIHAMRSVKDSKTTVNPSRSKPYKLPRRKRP